MNTDIPEVEMVKINGALIRRMDGYEYFYSQPDKAWIVERPDGSTYFDEGNLNQVESYIKSQLKNNVQ